MKSKNTIKYSKNMDEELNPIRIQSTKVIKNVKINNFPEENEYESLSENELIYKIKYELNKVEQKKAKLVLLKKFNKKM
jgi:hypothetical protein